MGIEAGTAALIGGLASGAGGAIGGALGKRGTQSNQPIRDPAFGPLQQQLINQALGKLRNPTEVARGVEERGISAINETFRLGSDALRNKLTAAGLGAGGVPVNAISNLETGRLREVGSFRAGIPLLEQQLQQQDFINALQLFSQEPVGNVIRSSTPGGAGQAIGQGFGQAGTLLGYLAGQGVFPQEKNAATAAVAGSKGTSSAFAR